MRKPSKGDLSPVGRLRFIRVLLGVVGLCFVFMTLEAPNLFRPKLVPYNNARPALEALVGGGDSLQQIASPDLNSRRHLSAGAAAASSRTGVQQQQNRDEEQPRKESSSSSKRFTNEAEGSSVESATTIRASPAVSSATKAKEQKNASHELQQAADVAWAAGGEMQKLVDSNWASRNGTAVARKKKRLAAAEQQQCPQVLLLSGEQLKQAKQVMVLPCGLASGSSITLVARPLKAHLQFMPHISMVSEGQQEMMVSQFMVELRGLKLVDAEDPPRILHVNPRLKGDWSGNPVIELNTCYRGQWGVAQRCEGWISSEEELVDGLPKCQNWLMEEGSSSGSSSSSSSDEKSKSWWLNRWINRPDKGATDWQYPFMEERLFVLTIRAGWEGYHVSVDGRHITSFPYRTGFILEEATGFTVGGDIDVKSVVATSLPSSHTSLSSEQLLEESEKYKAPPLPQGPVHLFIGILSASAHFAERMAVRKSWLQSKAILSSKVVARFFVGLHVDVEINLQVREEAEYFGDMVVLPFIDHYDLVVLKTIAICEYAVRNISAKHIMKTDDDTFVRVETMVNLLKITRKAPGLYMGNINQFHRPLREGKWAVTYEEWPEEEYPPYANGPGYIISSDIAKFILEQRQNHTLRLFKMEDVSMGMWVVQFNLGQAVHYVHNLKFCQWGCVEEYYTAHYQSPRQMLCMWEKLQQGEAQCCNMR